MGPPNFCPDGSVPLGGVIRGPNGNLYGITNAGGTTNSGTLFQLALACVPAADVTDSVAVVRSGLSYSIVAKLYGQTLTVKNMSGSPITGPIYVVLDGLSADATLDSAGKTACTGTLGSPFVSVPGPLTAGASVVVPLHFEDPTRGAISYTIRVLAGAGQP